MIGYWPFTTDTGSYAYDVSGNNLTGSFFGNTTWTSGHTDNAVTFDGDGDYIQINDSGGALNPGNDSWTMGAWIQTTDSSGTVAERYTCGWDCYASGSSADYGLSLSNGKVVYSMRTTDGSDTTISPESSSTVNDGQWHYVVGVLNRSSGTASIYVDGALENSIDASTFGTISNDGTPLFLGVHYIQSWASPQQYFTGKIDEFRLYRSALSSDQISRMYSQVVHKAPNKNGLIGYWSFEDATGTTATDFSGNGNSGSLTNMNTNTAWVDGKSGKALEFDGSNDYVAIDNPSSLSFPQGSVSFWMKTNTDTVQSVFSVTSSDYFIIYVGDGVSGLVNNELISIARNNSGTIGLYSYKTTNRSEIIGTGWHYVTITADGSSYKIYIDGQAKTVSTVLSNNPGDFTDISNINDADIGSRKNSGSFGAYMNGTLDDLRIYSHALSSSEVSTLYNSTKSGHVTLGVTPRNILDQGLVGHWTFDGKDLTATTVVDTSGNGNNGTLVPATQARPVPVRGRIGQALSFDGVDDYVNIPSRNGLTITTFSVGFWINPSAISNNSFLVSNLQTTLYFDGWGIAMDRNALTCGDGDVCLWLGQGQSSTYQYIDYPYNFPVGEWTHFVVTFDATTKAVKFYTNGSLLYSKIASFIGVPNSSAVTRIAEWNSTKFAGKMDDVRIYNRVLSSDEVKTLYGLGT